MVPRNMQDVLIKLLGQAVVIENKAGAGGSIGMAEVARATDGVTFGIATLSTHGVNPAVLSKLPYDAINDFVGVTEIVKAPGVLVINPAILPVKNFAEFVAYLKANPGKVSYATPATAPSAMWGAQFLAARAPKCTHSLPWCRPGHQRRAGRPGSRVLRPGELVPAPRQGGQGARHGRVLA
jgi:tripartite-type tricarboxylate transporter receptor subunit TctC